MKSLSIIFLFILSSNIFARAEVWMRIYNSDGVTYWSTNVQVFERSYLTGTYTYYGEGTSLSTDGENDANIWWDLSYTTGTSGATQPPLRLHHDYIIKVGNKYCKIEIGGNQPGGPDILISYAYGGQFVEVFHHDVIRLVGQGDWSTKSVTVKNSFNAGDVYIDNELRQNIGSGITENFGTPTFPHYIEAIDEQTSGGFVQRYVRWTDNIGQLNTTNIETSIDAADATYTANFEKRYNFTFKNSFIDGSIKVDGQQVSSPSAVFHELEGGVITAQALNQLVNGIQYIFTRWSDGVTAAQRTITAAGSSPNLSFTAEFTGKPHNSYRNLQDVCAVGEPIIIDWDEHPNTAVTHYKIYRKVKHDGVTGPETYLGMTQRGTTTYTDDMYVKTRSYVDLVSYDVRAYYSIDGTYSDVDYIAVYGEPGTILPKQNDSTKTAAELLEGYELSNYPNPFNPSTNISFTIPEAQNVKLLVYNLLGEKVKELINNSMQAGSYNVKWNGDNQFGRGVNSGVYFSVLQTQEKRIVKKMILSK